MPKVYQSDPADAVYKSLPERIRREIDRRRELLRRFPGLYPVMQAGRYRGKRRFTVGRQFHVYYTVYGPNQDCFITDITPARAQPE